MIDSIVLRLVLPIMAIGLAGFVAQKGWGFFNFVDWPQWLEIIMSVAALDMIIYWQHVLSHKIPFIWNIHKVHHADRDVDVTTGVRFHPFEILFSMIYKMFWILVVGPASAAVIVFEVLLNASALFNHANAKLPTKLDKVIRTVLVTPDMHRIHHSVIQRETDSNYGFCLSIWDVLFGTYNAEPEKGHEKMVIGLEDRQTDEPARLWWSLTWPINEK
ncbi:MAG: sterol desaturase family protein [Granulosicoccaceae bacterium]